MVSQETEQFVEILQKNGDNVLRFNFHRSQRAAMESERRIVAVIAGTQSGKTCIGPPWLHREIYQNGPGDYMVVSPNYPLLAKKALPEFRRVFERYLQLGTYTSNDKVFTVSPYGEERLFGERQDEPTQVYFGYAEDPDSLESATAKAAWLDEAGQKKFKLASWEAIRRRLSIPQGRVLITTTPYDLGWLKQKIHDSYHAGDPEIDLIRFESIDNPIFPVEEWERAKRDLPHWKFNLYYRGIFTRPAGLIHDSFDETKHTTARFHVPDKWHRYVGIDFGGVNTAAVFYAQKPGDQVYYLYKTYKAGGRTSEMHVREMMRGEPTPIRCAGGSKSEQQWRDEFRNADLYVESPEITDVEIGIERVYGFHARDEIIVFDDLDDYLEEKLTYSRELDDMNRPTEKIADKNSFHLMDAERYIMSKLHELPASAYFEEIEHGMVW